MMVPRFAVLPSCAPCSSPGVGSSDGLGSSDGAGFSLGAGSSDGFGSAAATVTGTVSSVPASVVMVSVCSPAASAGISMSTVARPCSPRPLSALVVEASMSAVAVASPSVTVACFAIGSPSDE